MGRSEKSGLFCLFLRAFNRKGGGGRKAKLRFDGWSGSE
jgi:hypothetical protein